MRRPILPVLAAVVVLLLVATAVLYQSNRKTSADFTSMKAEKDAVQKSYADAINGIAEIEDSLQAITAGENSKLVSQDLQAEQRMGEPNRLEALDRIAVLNASIQRTKEKIRLLEANLKSNGVKMVGLERMVKGLKKNVVEKEAFIAQLTQQVDSLQTQVAGLEVTVQDGRDSIEDKRRELGTIYYVIGTKKDLATAGVIVAKGGVLGLGKTLLVSGNFDDSQFTPIDTDQETTINATATKAQVLSPQPPSSYELKVEGNHVELRILDPKVFRTVKHLVIMTA